MGSCTSVHVSEAHYPPNGSQGDGTASSIGGGGGTKSAPPSILSSGDRAKKDRPTASKYIAATANQSPPASPAVDPHTLQTPALHTKVGSEGSLLNLPESLRPVGASPKNASQANRRRSNRSSDGRRVVAAVNASGTIVTTVQHPPPIEEQRKPSFPRLASGTGGGSQRHLSSRRQAKRRNSNNAIISRVALQFPLIRTSFFAIFRAFARYMKIVQKAEEEVRRKSARGPLVHTITLTRPEGTIAGAASGVSLSHLLKKTGTESKIETQLSATVGTTTRGAMDIELVEEEGATHPVGRVDTHTEGALTAEEEEMRQAEIKALLASAPSPLLQEPVLAATSAAAFEGGVSDHAAASPPPPHSGRPTSLERSASVAHASAIQPSVTAAQVRELGTLTPASLGEAIQAISGGWNGDVNGSPAAMLTPAEIQGLFNLSDLDGSKSISFREFLVAVALGFFLKEDLKTAEADQKERKEAYQAALHAGASPASMPVRTIGRIPSSPAHGPSSRAHHHTHSQQGVEPVSPFPPSPKALELQTTTTTTMAHTRSESSGGKWKGNTTSTTTTTTTMLSAPPGTVITALSTSSPPSPQHGQTLAVPGTSLGRWKRSGSFSVSSSTPSVSLLAHASTASTVGATSASGASSTDPIPFLEIQRGFRVVYRAFQEMDQDGSGDVDSDELKSALFAATNLKNDKELLETRFKELDFNASGEVDLAEFLYAMTSWVGLMDEEDSSANDDPTTMMR